MPHEELGDGGQGRYLPPDPGGLEPDLGLGPAPAPEPEAQEPPAQGGWQPPQYAQETPAAQGYAPQASQQQTGWTPPRQGWNAPAQPEPWVYAPQQSREPDNGAAVAGFTLAVVGGGLLLFTVGISSIVSVVCAGLGIFYSLKGRRRVDRGETPKHRSLAQAGFVTGIVTLVLALLATAFWALFGILYATDEGFRQDLEEGSSGGGEGFETTVRLMAVLGRAAWSLIS